MATWKQWKNAIRAVLDSTEGFNVETDDIAFFDIVESETLTLMQHKTTDDFLWGVQSSKSEDSADS